MFCTAGFCVDPAPVLVLLLPLLPVSVWPNVGGDVCWREERIGRGFGTIFVADGWGGVAGR